jgi:hypothetical protein
MPAAPRFVRVTSFRPNKGSKHRISHDLTPCRDALQVFSASLRKPARRYGYRGLKIFASLAFRFQDFQRLQELIGRFNSYADQTTFDHNSCAYFQAIQITFS